MLVDYWTRDLWLFDYSFGNVEGDMLENLKIRQNCTSSIFYLSRYSSDLQIIFERIKQLRWKSLITRFKLFDET